MQLKVGAEGARLDQMTPKMKMAMMIMPFFLFPITMNFASAVTFYWLTTNVISLCQAKFFRIPKVRKALNIPEMIQHKKLEPPKGKKKVVNGNSFNFLSLFLFRDFVSQSETQLITSKHPHKSLTEELTMRGCFARQDRGNL